MISHQQDPFEAASNVPDRPFAMWGQMDIRAEFVVLQKGVGKVPFDAQAHSLDDRRTVMDMILTPLAETKLRNATQREVIAESKEWSRIVWPSARACGITNARQLHQAYVKVTMVKTGRTWTNNKGDTVEATTFRFDKVFQSEQECLADYTATVGGSASPDDNPFDTATAQGPTGTPPAPQANGNGHNPNERNTAMMFLTALAAQHKGNPNGLAQAIATTPLISKYFTVNSPEVQALLA